MTTNVFALAVVRAHRSAPGCNSTEDDGKKDEIDFFRSSCSTISRDDMLVCGRLLIASLGNQNANEQDDYQVDDDEDDEEEEVFNRERDVIGFRELDVYLGHAPDVDVEQHDAAARKFGAREDVCTFFHFPTNHAKFLSIRGIGCADPRFKRKYYIQQTVRFIILLSNVPFQSFLKEKVHVVAQEFFTQDDTAACIEYTALQRLYDAISTSIDFSELPYRELFIGLPIVNLVRRLGKEVVALLRLLLLEGRIVFFSTNPSTASAATLALLALLPGVLALVEGESSIRTIQVVLYRLRRYGMPFSIVNEDFIVQPCFVSNQEEAVYNSKGFLVGTSDPLILKHPKAKLDVVVDLDVVDVIAFPTTKMEHSYAFGSATAAFADSLAERFGRNLEDTSSQRSPRRISAIICAGSGASMESAHAEIDWVVKQFQTYFEHFLDQGFKELFSGACASDGKFDPYHPSIASLLEELVAPVFGENSTFYAEYGRAWTHSWQRTSNYESWLSAHRLERKRSSTAVIAPPPQEGEASYTYPNGDEYEGTFVNGKRHGFGVYIEFVTKNRYEGDWVNDKRHGKGILVSKANGYIYDGEWKNDERCGHGHSSLKNSETYTGFWEKNRFHSAGVYVNADGDVYDGEWNAGVKEGVGKLTIARPRRNEEFGGLQQFIGEWKNSRIHGTGAAHYMDGTKYVGTFMDGRRHGNGVLMYTNGDKYDGTWWKGFRHGEGSFFSSKSGTTKEGTWKNDSEVDGDWFIVYQNGDKYNGECRRGRPWGQGTCKYANGSSYSGGWVDGLREGHGVCVSPDGTILEGQWKNSLFVKEARQPSTFYDVPLASSPRNAPLSPRAVRSQSSALHPESGSHVHTYSNGDTYDGEFKDHLRHGFGVFTERATGNVYEGEWRHNVRHGNGVLTSGMKDFIYDGNWEHDARNGYGHCVIRGCETYSGDWCENQFHGVGKYIDAEGSVYDGEFRRGKKHGMGKQTSTDKKETYSGEWQDGYRHGIGDATFEDGSTYSGSWRNDLQDGEGILITADGEKYSGQWRKGQKEGFGIVHIESSGIIKEGMWAADEPADGDWTIQFPDGSKFTGQCVKGRPHGHGVCKYTNGDLYDGEWVHGKRHGIGTGFFANGESFVGEWENNHVSLHGKGKLTLADGTIHVYAK